MQQIGSGRKFESRSTKSGNLGLPPTGTAKRPTENQNKLGNLSRLSVVVPIKGPYENRVLSSLPQYVQKRLRPHLREVIVAKDDYLFQQDEAVKCVYFPETAVVSEYQILEDGRTIEVSIVGNEGALGVPSAFSSCRAINCSQVCVAGKVLKINSDYLERELSADQSLQYALHQTILRQMKQLSQKVICNTFHSVEQRFCAWLLMLQDRFGGDCLKITHEHIARVLGVHRPSITCIAQGLRDKGLIDYSRGRVLIRNRAGLEKNACICYGESDAMTLHLSGNIH